MKKWVQKALVQKAISYLPFRTSINYFFQKYVTKGVYLTDLYFYDRLGHARDHLAAYQTYQENAIPQKCLEIGTGWYPIVPISFFLSGVEKTYSVDIAFLTSKARIKTTIQHLLECGTSGQLQQYIPCQPTRWAALNALYAHYDTLSLAQILEALHIDYLIEDARHLSLPDQSIDLINSNNTFEHIYPEILTPILKEFTRIIRPTGVQSHFIDMSDHFAHFDPTISIYNFLRFSDRQWQIMDNDIQPQSRLRMDDYEALYAQLRIPITHKTFRAGDIEALRPLRLAATYQHKPLEALAISHCHFVSYQPD